MKFLLKLPVLLFVIINCVNIYPQKDKWFHLVGEILFTDGTKVQFNKIHKYSNTREFYVKGEEAIRQLTWNDLKELKVLDPGILYRTERITFLKDAKVRIITLSGDEMETTTDLSEIRINAFDERKGKYQSRKVTFHKDHRLYIDRVVIFQSD